ncbi:hypothetical protein E2562_006671 [Oryza meyeriana var. granulata]|uniref:Uncharacterized protein n=1 Tax=Oryza meyeriana var. granulata TaxID=110450 RepID=A0A6G1EG22_9ORYZ|nr:hypothetical protein E2562_006671 [Oryza meyeriana var. granulata]
MLVLWWREEVVGVACSGVRVTSKRHGGLEKSGGPRERENGLGEKSSMRTSIRALTSSPNQHRRCSDCAAAKATTSATMPAPAAPPRSHHLGQFHGVEQWTSSDPTPRPLSLSFLADEIAEISGAVIESRGSRGGRRQRRSEMREHVAVTGD